MLKTRCQDNGSKWIIASNIILRHVLNTPNSQKHIAAQKTFPYDLTNGYKDGVFWEQF